MSPIESNRGRRRTAFGFATAAGGALAAAMLSMGTAHADPTVVVDSFSPPDPYAVLFGAAGGDTVGTQGYEDNALDTHCLSQRARASTTRSTPTYLRSKASPVITG